MNNPYHYHPYAHRRSRQNKADLGLWSGRKEQPAQKREPATIIEYSGEKKAENSYPYKIISPPSPSRCCPAHMKRIGAIQTEGNNQFYYKRCLRCGFTVREFLPEIDIDRLARMGVSDWDHPASWVDQIQREVQVGMAA